MPNVSTGLTRSDLSRIFRGDMQAVLAFEKLLRVVVENTAGVTAGAESTQALNDATVITLSPNDAFGNERVLAVDPNAFSITDYGPGNTLVLSSPITAPGGFRLTFDLPSDTELSMPASGTVPSSAIGPYPDDAAAATAGVQVGEWYAKAGGTVVWRVA